MGTDLADCDQPVPFAQTGPEGIVVGRDPEPHLDRLGSADGLFLGALGRREHRHVSATAMSKTILSARRS